MRISARRIVLLCLAIVVLAAAVGCGGGDDSGSETFEEDDFAITFEHPSTFSEIDDVSIASTAGAASRADSARGLDERNLILVSSYNLQVAVDEENLAQVQEELDAVLSQAAKQELSGARVEFGGLPGYEYTFDLETDPPVRSRFVALFDGMTEYTINCQSTSERRDEMDAACQQALETLRTT